MKSLALYVRNLGLWLNMTTMTLVGQDPRKTISAFCYLKDIKWAIRLVNRLYKDELHCRNAAKGWNKVIDRSLW